VIKDQVNFVTATKFVIEDEEVVERKLRDEIILQHTTHRQETLVINRTNQPQCISVTDRRTDRQTDGVAVITETSTNLKMSTTCPEPFHFHVTTLDQLFTHMCLCHQTVYCGTGQRSVMRISNGSLWIGIQDGAKNGAIISHCKYSENYMTELRRNMQIFSCLLTHYSLL